MSFDVMMRAMMSVPPPGGKPTIMRAGRLLSEFDCRLYHHGREDWCRKGAIIGSNHRKVSAIARSQRSHQMPASVSAYIERLPSERKRRLQAIRAAIVHSVDGVRESMRYRMPTFEKEGTWVALASQKHYVAVYFCSAQLIEGVRAHHPELDCGVGCVRIRDSQHVPVYELREAFVRALTAFTPDERGASKRAPRSKEPARRK